MGISDLRRDLCHIPGTHELIMQYEDGGATEVYSMGDVRAPVPCGSGQAEIAAALTAAAQAIAPAS